MDMWNWLHDCYDEGLIALEDLEATMIDDSAANRLWEEYSAIPDEFIEFVRDEVKPFIKYIKRKEKDD
jgi:hypothetical protein